MDTLVDEVLLHNDSTSRTFYGDVPFKQNGLHWKFATDQPERALSSPHWNARAYRDGDEVARGRVTDIALDNDNTVAVCIVAPSHEPA